MVDIHPSLSGTLCPSVHKHVQFNVEKDCQTLMDAIHGSGINEQVLIDVICHRSWEQRRQIKSAFKAIYNQDLLVILKRELSGNLWRLIQGVLVDPVEYNARCLYKATTKTVGGINVKMIIDILCTQTNEEMRKLKDAYQKVGQSKGNPKADLESDVNKALSNTSSVGSVCKSLLIGCLKGTRAQLSLTDVCKYEQNRLETLVDHRLAESDALDMHQLGLKKWANDEHCLLQFLLNSNPVQIRVTVDEYEELSNKGIVSEIENEMPSNLGYAMLTIIFSQISLAKYYAKLLYEATISRWGTRDSTLIRVVATRCDVDLEQIKMEFFTSTKKTLASVVQSETSGSYQSALLALVG